MAGRLMFHINGEVVHDATTDEEPVQNIETNTVRRLYFHSSFYSDFSIVQSFISLISQCVYKHIVHLFECRWLK